MNKLDFYKEMYFKEHDLKHKLDDKVSVQIGLITLLFTINAYILKSDLPYYIKTVIEYSTIIVGVTIVLSLFFLGQSFMNLGRAHKYRELASMNAFRSYDEQLSQAQRVNEYEEYLEKEFADCATANRRKNIWRTEKLANCKKSIFGAFVVTFINSVLYIIGVLMQ